MMIALLLAIAAPQIVFQAEATPAAAVRLGDIADLEALPPDLRRRAGALVLLPHPYAETAIEHHRLASRARSLLPGLAPWLTEPGDGRLRIRALVPAPAGDAFVKVDGEVGAGTIVSVISSNGAVSIERQGVATQPGRYGRHVFVRFLDGAVVAARCCR
jgi:hypothetical protein